VPENLSPPAPARVLGPGRGPPCRRGTAAAGPSRCACGARAPFAPTAGRRREGVRGAVGGRRGRGEAVVLMAEPRKSSRQQYVRLPIRVVIGSGGVGGSDGAPMVGVDHAHLSSTYPRQHAWPRVDSGETRRGLAGSCKRMLCTNWPPHRPL